MFEKVSDIDWARAAAFIDGEGNIHINRRGAEGKHRGHYLKVTVTNTDPRLLLWFKQKFGGAVNGSGKRQKSNHRQAFRWLCSCRTAAEVLRGCLPYLLLKRDQAEIALAFQSTLRGPTGRGQKVADDVFQQRDVYMSQISEAKWKNYEWPNEIASLEIIKEN